MKVENVKQIREQQYLLNPRSREEVLKRVKQLYGEYVFFGGRWDFEIEGERYIVRCGDPEKGYDISPEYFTDLEGYDVTVNIILGQGVWEARK